jgi:hypothetical protein
MKLSDCAWIPEYGGYECANKQNWHLFPFSWYSEIFYLWCLNHQKYKITEYQGNGEKVSVFLAFLLMVLSLSWNNKISHNLCISRVGFDYFPEAFRQVLAAQSSTFCVVFCRLLPFWPFSFGHWIVHPSSIYDFRLSLWYLQIFRKYAMIH